MDDINRGQGSWGFEIPPVVASKLHAALYQQPVSLKSPPKPHIRAQIRHWDEDHVRMPFSPKNLFPVKDENGERSLKEHWEIIQKALLQPITCSEELEAAINSYNSRLPKCFALHHFFGYLHLHFKAYVGFHSCFEGALPATATGNWGCGAYRGDPNLKFLIQLMACSAARRDIVYFTFGDAQLCDNINEIYLFLATNQITIMQLWRYLGEQWRFDLGKFDSISISLLLISFHMFTYRIATSKPFCNTKYTYIKKILGSLQPHCVFYVIK